MSYTEIYKFKNNGDSESIGHTQNAFRSAMAIWCCLEEKYLPPYIPSFILIPEPGKRYYRSMDMIGPGLKEVWGLFDKKNVSFLDKIVLGTTFDNVIVLKENIPQVLDAFRTFERDTSLKEQADIIEKELTTDDDLIGIAWHQTSVSGDKWSLGWYNDTTEEYDPYNILKQTEHWNLFDDLKELKQ